MASFRFNLESVLNYRFLLEETAKEELAISLATYQQEKEVLNSVEAELAATMIPEDCGDLNLDHLILKEIHQARLSEELEAQMSKVAAAEEDVDKCRRQLEEKTQERKVMETIKEKRWQEFRYQQEQEEQKFIDDLATAQYLRKIEE